DYRKGIDVTVVNRQPLVLPATLQVTYVDGSQQDIRVPWETWQQHRSYVIHVDGTQRVKSVTIDPAHVLPDAARDNNTFVMP
ncbi:MAG TPA: Ig-like domain-containing protein, partial [Rhodanobacter sp.]